MMGAALPLLIVALGLLRAITLVAILSLGFLPIFSGDSDILATPLEEAQSPAPSTLASSE